ncbi:MAG: polysaccharide deacetylase family protein [Clostridia bacterium]|nr:polysaccharide deacetylase family protein [Clostridia bacterium]
MRILVVNKKMLFAYGALLLCAVLTFFFSSNAATSVFNEEMTERLLPIYNVDRGDEKVCALTFDAAWDDADTDQLIEILDTYQVKATFFMVGSWVEKYPNSVKKFADKGHEIMNHSDTHPHINQLSTQKVKEEIAGCADKIEAVTGVRPTLFRGPYGEYNNTVIRAAQELGHKTLQWDVDSLDWKDLDTQDIVTRVLKRVKPGSVMLFHNGAKNTPAALPQIIKKLQEEGYRFVTATELLLPEPTSINSQGTQIAAKTKTPEDATMENTPPEEPLQAPEDSPVS